MCGRISLFVRWGVLEDRFEATAPERLAPSYNVAPSENLAVIRTDAREEIRLHEWGLQPAWADDPSTRFINARAETIDEKPSFADAAANRRCLVLADGFYEWQDRTTGRQPFRIERTDREPFAMAGLFEHGPDATTVAVVTTTPNDVVAPIHDRMAAVLDEKAEDAWLAADDPGDRMRLLQTPDPDGFHAYPVSTALNDPGNDGPEFLERASVSDEDPQTGFDDFQ